VSSYLTSITLIETIRREGMIPSSQNTFTDDDFLAMANQEMRIGMVPTIMTHHQEYFVTDSDPIPLVADVNNYEIPYRAIGGKFRDIFYVDTGSNLQAMTRINPDNRSYFQQTNVQNRFVFYYLQGTDVVLTPNVGSTPTGSLLFSYYLRPNELVSETRVGIIETITTGASTTVLALSQIPTGFTTTELYDILQTKPGHKTLGMDITATSIDSVNKTITFNNTDIPSGLVVGDYVAFAEECVIPQIPSELHDVLAQRVVLRCLQALGDQMGYNIASAKLGEMNVSTSVLVDNRSEGNPEKILNLKGPLRSSKVRRRGWGF
jgi:hypothetical protein